MNCHVSARFSSLGFDVGSGKQNSLESSASIRTEASWASLFGSTFGNPLPYTPTSVGSKTVCSSEGIIAQGVKVWKIPLWGN